MYANTFEPYRQFYQENESLDLEAIRKEEHGMVTMTLIYPASKFRLRGALSPFPSTPTPVPMKAPWELACRLCIDKERMLGGILGKQIYNKS